MTCRPERRDDARAISRRMRRAGRASAQRVLGRAGFRIVRVQRNADVSAFDRQLALAGADAKIVLDVGAYDGDTARVYLAVFPRAQVFAFEPFPQSFASLSALARDEPRLVPLELGLSDQIGSSVLSVVRGAQMNSLLAPLSDVGDAKLDWHLGSVGRVEVATTSLDRWVADTSLDVIDVLKLDVQGAELAVLRGGSGLLAQKRIRVIYAEVAFREMYAGQPLFRDVDAYLARAGYCLHSVWNLRNDSNGCTHTADAIFVPSPTLDDEDIA